MRSVRSSHSGHHDSVPRGSNNETLCVGRNEELGLIEGRLVWVDDNDFGSAKSLRFLGAPRIGKTTLLQRAKEQMFGSFEAAKRYTCPVLVSWRDKAIDPNWSESVLRQINKYVYKTRWKDGAAADVISRYRDHGTGTRGELLQDLQRLGAEGPPLRIVFLLDDLDVALEAQVSATGQDLVSPWEFLDFAERWPQTVKLVVTSRDYLRIPDEHRALFRRERWLRLLAKEHARELARRLLHDADDETLASVIQWAGYHPYHISTLCTAVRATADSEQAMSGRIVERAAYWWKASQEIEDHLTCSWDHLQLRQDLRRIIVIRKLLGGSRLEEEQSPPLEDAIRFLEDRAVICVCERNGRRAARVPSRLLREFMHPLISSQVHQEGWSAAETTFLQLSVVAMFLTFFSMFIVYVYGSPTAAKWAIAWFGMPLVYLFWRGPIRRLWNRIQDGQ